MTSPNLYIATVLPASPAPPHRRNAGPTHRASNNNHAPNGDALARHPAPHPPQILHRRRRLLPPPLPRRPRPQLARTHPRHLPVVPRDEPAGAGGGAGGGVGPEQGQRGRGAEGVCGGGAVVWVAV